MASLEANNITAGIRLSILSAFESARSDIAEILQRKRVESRTRAELEGCTDRELNDIGISRSDISRIAREAGRAI